MTTEARPRARWRFVRRTALVLLALMLVAAWQLPRLVDLAMTPGLAFSEETPPPAPDYARDDAWSALPGRVDLADRNPTGLAGVRPEAARVDVFYLHPTSYVGPRWNAPTTDAALNAATDRVATGIQASAFNACCAVYAPRYRQANGTAFFRPRPDGDRALNLAYEDIRRAFVAFQARRGGGRPFILAGHSQGSVHGARLLAEVIAPSAARSQLVAAYLLGGRVTVEGLRETAPGIAPCARADDTGCVVAWNARGPRFVPTAFELARPDPRERLCTNPLTWRLDGRAAEASLHRGAVFLDSDDHRVRPAFSDARCVDGVLVVSPRGDIPRDLPSRILDRMLGRENHHPVEVQLFFMNLRENAALRAAAFSPPTAATASPP